MRAGILIFDGADELDVVGPYRVLASVAEVAGHVDVVPIDMHLVAEREGTVTLGSGMRIEASDTFTTCPPLDILVVPGGSSGAVQGRRSAQRSEAVKAFVSTRAKDARITASVCTGAFILAEAGLLAGRRANTHWRFREELVDLLHARGEPFELVPERVVWDGDLVTGGGVTSGIDVALSIVAALFGPEAERVVRKALEIETPG